MPLIFEVFLQVAEYFNAAEATVPSCVCHAWNEVFASRIWHSVVVDLWFTGMDLTPEGLTRNAHHIRSLAISCICDPAFFLVPYMRLTSLQFHGAVDYDRG
ncbi:hypothetical protein CPC16_007311 [Podila verticillata]|nr:hypothetical protein CPC16_007311 [Podila verticillata]